MRRVFGTSWWSPDESADDRIAELEGEVTLLEEEVARLRFERRRVTDAATVVALMREIVANADDPSDRGDEAWDVLAEAVAMRQTLIHACREIESGMSTLRGRLELATVERLDAADDAVALVHALEAELGQLTRAGDLPGSGSNGTHPEEE